ncbi:MAG: hypothetical protein D4S01_10380, partial [Dehalococcoidia bacterium]
MITDKTIHNLIKSIFIDPQEILGGVQKDRKLDDVHLISVRLLSGYPLKGRGCRLDPILLKLGFTNFDKDLKDLNDEDLSKILSSLKRFDGAIGAWTIVHDIASNEQRPLWRISAEISPINCLNVSIERTAEKTSRYILCIDCE